MSLDFDLEAEVARRDAILLTEQNLTNTRGTLPFVLSVLEGLGIKTISPEELILLLIREGIRLNDGSVSLPGNIEYPSFPSLSFLRKLPDHYFGREVELQTQYGFKAPFSLVRVKDDFYIRSFLLLQEFEDKINQR